MANKSTLIARRDYGMKIAMPGFDLHIATDNQLLFNSSFPIFQIKILAALGVITANASGLPTTAELNAPNYGGEFLGVFTQGYGQTYVYRWYHGLGYPPFFIPVGANGVLFGTQWSVDEQYLYYTAFIPPTIGWSGQRNGVVDMLLLCPIDLSKDIEYPYTAKPLDMDYGKSVDYGFKSAEYGEITEHNLDNLGVDPTLQSQMVLAVKTMATKEAGATAIEYIIPSGMSLNDVMVYGFVKQTNTYDTLTITSWKHVYQYGQTPPSIMFDTANNMARLVLSGSETDAAMIMTRMPMVAPSYVEVTL